MILDRYIVTNLVKTTLLVQAGLLTLTALFILIGELEDVGRGNYDISQALNFVLLSMPKALYQTLPLAVLVGGLWGLGDLAKTSELTVMRSAGLSILRILQPAAAVGLVIAGLMYALGEWGMPSSESMAQRLRADALGKPAGVEQAGGYWLRDGLAFVSVGRVVSATHLRDIERFEFDTDKQLRSALQADVAIRTDDGWLLRGISETAFVDNRTVVREIAQRSWDVALDDQLLRNLSIDPRVLSMQRLRENIRFLRDNGQAYAQHEVALWMKLAAPVSVLVMLLVAMPFVFGSLRSTHLGLRILAGSIIGIVFHILNQVVGQMSQVFHLNAMLSAFSVPILVTIIALTLIRRLR
jgi:lipopolysaccharide export system permease protein